MGLKYLLETQQLKIRMSCTNCLFVSGSILLTAAMLAVGMSFFAPYWLSNVHTVNETSSRRPVQETYLSSEFVSDFPDRGLWAQCGAVCQWFWEDGYRLQTHLLTPLKWHLATQVLYFIGAVFLLAAEIFARVQLCCDERTVIYWVLAIIVYFSALLQLAAIATFGGGASRDPYNAISDPAKTTLVLGKGAYYQDAEKVGPFLGWCFWMAVVGDILSVIAGSFFITTACWVARKY